MSEVKKEDSTKIAETNDVNHGDAMSPANVGQIQAITLMRIYDVLMAQYMEVNEKGAEKLLELHATGGFLGPSPTLNGVFVYDVENVDGNDS